MPKGHERCGCRPHSSASLRRIYPLAAQGKQQQGPMLGAALWGWLIPHTHPLHSLPGRHVLTIISSQLMLLIRNMTEMCLFMGTALFVPHLQNTAVQARIQPAAALTPSSIGTQCTVGGCRSVGLCPLYQQPPAAL